MCARGTREEPGTLTQGAVLSFGNRTQNFMVAGARPNHQADRGSDPNHRGIWSPPPRAGLGNGKKKKPISTPNGAELTMFFVPARIRSRARQKGWGPFSNWYKSREGGLEQGPFESPPLGGGLWARTCAVWCLLMHGSYRQGEGTNGGRLRVFSSAQAPWRVLLQALDQP